MLSAVSHGHQSKPERDHLNVFDLPGHRHRHCPAEQAFLFVSALDRPHRFVSAVKALITGRSADGAKALSGAHSKIVGPPLTSAVFETEIGFVRVPHTDLS